MHLSAMLTPEEALALWAKKQHKSLQSR